MRLIEAEITTFIRVLSDHVGQGEGNLYLYGSRTNDSLKGGDIDLLLVLASPPKMKEVSKNKYEILNQFKKHLEDQKIDFSIISEPESLSDPFYSSVIKGAILLHKW